MNDVIKILYFARLAYKANFRQTFLADNIAGRRTSGLDDRKALKLAVLEVQMAASGGFLNQASDIEKSIEVENFITEYL